MPVDVLLVCYGTLAAFAVVVCFIAVAYLLYMWYQHRIYDHIPGPKRTSFIFGNLDTLKSSFDRGDFFAQMIWNWMTEYGNTVKIMVLHVTVVMTADLEAVKTLLVTGGHPKAEKNYKILGYLYGERFIGTGLVTEVDHERWAQKRAFMNPAFNKGFLKSLMPEYNETGDILMNKLATLADGKTQIRLADHFHRVTLDVIGKVAFGMDINSVENQDSPFPKAIFKSLDGFSQLIRMPVYKRLNPLHKWSMRQEVRKAVRFLRHTGKEIFAKRKAAIEAGEYTSEDILTYVMQAHEKNPAITIEDIVDEFVTFFIAGQETTANAVSFVLMEIGRRPDVWNRLQEEVDSVIGDKTEIDNDDIGKLEYMSMVLKESLRLFPPVPLTFRQPQTEIMVGGYLIPPKTIITISTFASSRLPEYFPDPLDFQPERFNPKNANRPNTYSYFPFALGPRNCIGQNFAQIEAKLLLAKFIQRFNMQLDMNQTFDIKETTTLRPKSGVLATLTLRQ